MLILLALILIHVLILSKLVFLPYPELFIYPYLTNKGLLPYTQILDQHFPGLMFFPINLNTLGMLTPNDARVWQYGIVVVTHILLFVISKKIFKSYKLALVSNIFYMLWHPYFEGWVLWIDSLMPLLLLPAYYFVVKYFDSRAKSDILVAGIFLGIALLFKQVILPLIVVSGFLLFLKTKNLKVVSIFGLGILIPILLMILYVIRINVWNDFVFWTVKFNLETYAEMGRKYATPGDALRLFVAFGLPLVLSCLYFVKTRKEVVWTCVFFFCTLVFAYARFDPVHIQPSLVFVSLMAPLLFKVPKVLIAVLIALYLVPSFILLSRFYQSHIGSKVYFFGDFEQRLVTLVQEKTSKDDKIFVFATTPHIYQMADRLPPGNVFVFHFPWFFVRAEDRILEGLVKDPPRLVIRDSGAEVENQVLVKFAPKVDNYININYELDSMINSTEILIKK